MAFAPAENLAHLHLLLRPVVFLGSMGHVVSSGFYKSKPQNPVLLNEEQEMILLSCSLGVALLEGSSVSPIQDTHEEFCRVALPQLPVPHVTKFALFLSNQRHHPDASECGLSCL